VNYGVGPDTRSAGFASESAIVVLWEPDMSLLGCW